MHNILLDVADGVIETDSPVTSVKLLLLVWKTWVFTVCKTCPIFLYPVPEVPEILTVSPDWPIVIVPDPLLVCIFDTFNVPFAIIYSILLI